jgi:hypothetical protein
MPKLAEGRQPWVDEDRPSAGPKRKPLTDDQKEEVRRIIADRQLELEERLDLLKSIPDNSALKAQLIDLHKKLIKKYESVDLG